MAAGSAGIELDRQWEQVLARAAGAGFVYAVRSTGIFCRPGCPSRRPARAQVRFFADPEQARAAGFRACLRCSPEGPGAGAQLAARVAAYLEKNLDRQVSLAELAGLAGLGAGTVQRVFMRVMGMSPRAHAGALRAERFRTQLQGGSRITDAVYAAGFSGPGRASERAPLGMPAKTYKARGRGERIGYATGAHASLGRVLVASTERGVCAVLLGAGDDELSAELGRRFPAAEIFEDAAQQSRLAFVLRGLSEPAEARELPLDLRGTAFQARVWAALGAIPRGETRTYTQVAEAVGNPKAVRAVARACAENPAALVVPCHRVIGSNGRLTGYRWGLEHKRLLLALERETAAKGPAGK